MRLVVLASFEAAGWTIIVDITESVRGVTLSWGIMISTVLTISMVTIAACCAFQLHAEKVKKNEIGSRRVVQRMMSGMEVKRLVYEMR